ncbi:cytochrome c oxidase subunit 3 [Sphingobacterium griseoflavum]|uniref:Cytochrome oxidase subunit III n=1 Tax=Sphingobacterium griseoflavum TaxID=1474952 RepID=A0ABQ3HSE8_9SPHI|nr:cytochrome c oxidase subunit 3 [Sphingobacterium griseoflavum]GHE23764.1 cytochrome oxidase subunit III [Sphingobacterium griseoflavum]
MDTTEYNTEELLQSRKAKKFNLWLGMIGMFMMFAALSSGFIVYTASGVDKGIKTILPVAFTYSTVVLLVSSLTLHFAYQAVKAEKFAKQRLFLLLTMVLGLVFFAIQLHAWHVFAGRGIYFVNNNASQSFIYVFTGLHLAHIIAGLIVLVRCYLGALKPIPFPDNQFRMNLAIIFWHFLDLLWIYIYVFLLLNQ